MVACTRPDVSSTAVGGLIEDDPQDVRWHSASETKRLVSMMTERNYLKVQSMMDSGRRRVGTVYKRTRDGVQRAELRCDGIAGCLRTPPGVRRGSSSSVVEGREIRFSSDLLPRGRASHGAAGQLCPAQGL